MNNPDDRDPNPEPLIDLGVLTAGVQRTAIAAVALGVVGAIVAALTHSSPIGGFFTGAGVVLVLGVLALVTMSALKAADRAQKRGERLSSEDVGLLPTRRERE